TFAAIHRSRSARSRNPRQKTATPPRIVTCLLGEFSKNFFLGECLDANHFADGATDIFDLLFRQLRKHWQRNKLVGQTLRNWERAPGVAEISACILQMN